MNHPTEDSVQMEIKILEEKTRKQEHRTHILESKSTQIINLYFIFQALILLSSTATSSSLKCSNWWIPLSLSLLSAILNLISIFKNSSKIICSWDEIDQNRADLGVMIFYRLTKSDIDQVLPGTPLNQVLVSRDEREIIRPRVGLIRWLRRRLSPCLSVGLSVGFSVVVIYGCYALLC